MVTIDQNRWSRSVKFTGHDLLEWVVTVDQNTHRCHLKGSEGDSLHAVLCAAGYNIRWLLRMITKKGLGLFLRLLNVCGFENLKRKLHQILAMNLNMRHSLCGVVI